MNDTKLFILGGRNENDVQDIQQFDIIKKEWKQVDVGHPIPKPRRRHSCILVSNCLIMFGGFDGEFYDDLHLMDLYPSIKKTCVEASTKDQEYLKMIDQQSSSDFSFKIESGNNTSSFCGHNMVYANKALVMYRTIENERIGEKSLKESQGFSTMSGYLEHEPSCPEFLKRVYKLKKDETILLGSFYSQLFEHDMKRSKVALVRLLGYLYTSKITEKLTLSEV